jgi:WD40 repeat protein
LFTHECICFTFSHKYFEAKNPNNLYVYFSASVFCCDIDKTGQFAVTGGEDDVAYVWDLRTGEVKLTCKDNTVGLNAHG